MPRRSWRRRCQAVQGRGAPHASPIRAGAFRSMALPHQQPSS